MKSLGKALLIAAPLLVTAVYMVVAQPAYSYLPVLATPTVRVQWASLPVTWNLNPATTVPALCAGTSAQNAHISGARTVASVMQSAFNTWTGAPNIALSASRGADSAICEETSSPAGNNICFICGPGSEFSGTETLAVTIFTFNGATGVMSKADILFNPTVTYTTDPAPNSADGQTTFDLQTIATHEIGHFFGLDHSAVVNAVMFPFSANFRESLSYDDVAGMTLLYPKNPPDVVPSAISGTIRFAAGGGVFGAHVFADSTTAVSGYPASIRKGPIGTLTDPSGNYTITGLPVDSYNVTVEPLDGPVTNAEVPDYAKVFGMGSVKMNFTTRQH